MKQTNLMISKLCFLVCLASAARVLAQVEIPVEKNIEIPGQAKPILVSMSGLTGEAASTLQFDLYVQGFAFTNAESAQYLITGSNNGNLQARASDPHNKSTLVSKAYSGASLRRQAHAFADDFIAALPQHAKGIARTQIAFKGENSPTSEIYVADFDGHSAVAVTKDNNLVAAPCWVPGHLALYYVSYKLNHVDIFYHDLSTGARRVWGHFNGSNMSPAASPGGSQIAFISSMDGWTDLYVANSEAGGLKRLTKSPQDESSPCWSPDGKWICFAAKEKEHRTLCIVSPSGGAVKTIGTGGMPSPTEPDWSPDGKWIAFTAQFRSGFQICVVPAEGGTAVGLVEGEDPSWAPNSRTLAFGRRRGGHYTLSLLDVPTKQVKDVSRIPGISSQSQPSWAK
jgi:TolB protein